MQEALQNWQNALAHARRTNDLWLQGWPVDRIPLALTWLGRFEETEAAAVEALELTRKTQDWGDYSVALGALVLASVARGDFDLAERRGRETMMMVHRSRYPWGGAAALTGVACARFLRGAWAEAEDALDIAVEPGRLFDEPGPAILMIAWVYRQFLHAHAGAVDEVKGLAENLEAAMREAGSDIVALPGLCALVEIADLIGAPHVATYPYDILSRAAQRGVVFSNGWLFLIQRVLGVAAGLQGSWENAETHFQTAIDVAMKVGARPELGRTYMDYARMRVARNAPDDSPRAAELVQRASLIFAEFGMAPFSRTAAALAETLHTSLSLAGPRVVHRDDLGELEREILRSIARGRTTQQVAYELNLSLRSVADHVNALYAKIGVDGPAGATAYAISKGIVVQTPTGTTVVAPSSAPIGPGEPPPYKPLQAGRPVIILFTDMEGSTALIQRLGDEKAQDVLRAHNRILRGCLPQHGGSEIKHTGDGLMVSFASAGSAIECAVAIQRELAQYNREHPRAAVHVRIGLNAGEPIAEDGQLFGAAVNAAARICGLAQPDQILVSDVVRQIATGTDVVFLDQGPMTLRGFSEPFHVYEVQWKADGG